MCFQALGRILSTSVGGSPMLVKPCSCHKRPSGETGVVRVCHQKNDSHLVLR